MPVLPSSPLLQQIDAWLRQFKPADPAAPQGISAADLPNTWATFNDQPITSEATPPTIQELDPNTPRLTPATWQDRLKGVLEQIGASVAEQPAVQTMSAVMAPLTWLDDFSRARLQSGLPQGMTLHDEGIPLLDAAAPGPIGTKPLLRRAPKLLTKPQTKAAGIPGLVSRSQTAAAQLPERMQAPSILNALKRLGAPQDELALTRLAESLPKTGQVPRADVVRILEENLPKLSVTELPKPARVSKHLVEQLKLRNIEVPTTPEGWSELRGRLQQEAYEAGQRWRSTPYDQRSYDDPAYLQMQELQALEQEVMKARRQYDPRKRWGPRQNSYEERWSLPGGEDYKIRLYKSDPMDAGTWEDSYRVFKNPNRGEMGEAYGNWIVEDSAGNRMGTVWADGYDEAVARAKKEGYIQKPGGTFEHSHFPGQKNVAFHTRSKTRRLVEPGAPVPETVPYPKTTDPGFAEWIRSEYGTWMDPTTAGSSYLDSYFQYLKEQAGSAIDELGPKGLFIEEAQSDLMTKAREHGFRPPPGERVDTGMVTVTMHTPDGQRIPYGLHNAEDAKALATRIEESGGRAEVVPERLPQRYAEIRRIDQELEAIDNEADLLRSEKYALAQNDPRRQEVINKLADVTRREEALRAELDKWAVPRHAVPRLPYAEDYMDLAMKAELSQAAQGNKEWLGWTSGKTQADRYSLSSYVDRVTYNPQTNELRAYKGGKLEKSVHLDPKVDDLGDYVGADLARQIKSGQAKTEPVPAPEGHRYGRTYRTQQAAEDMAQSLRGNLREGRELVVEQMPGEGAEGRWALVERDLGAGPSSQFVIEGEDLAVGGHHLRRLYDEILPAKMQKLVKKYGLTVEQGLVRVKGGAEPAWIVKLPAEVRQRLLREGLPLMTLAPFLFAQDDESGG